MEDKVKLSVLGFSFNQTRTGTYGLVLAEEDGVRRLMVVVGTPEAQSIAFRLQGAEPPRPLTHDLMQALLNTFDIRLLEIDIYKYEDGVFFSKLLLKQKDRLVEIESRTSDAVAIALRTKSPIYTSETIMKELGIILDDKSTDEISNDDLEFDMDYSLLELDELESMLKDAIDGEDYELASMLRDELKRKNGK